MRIHVKVGVHSTVPQYLMSSTLLIKLPLLFIKKQQISVNVKKILALFNAGISATYPWSTKVNLPSILILDTYSIGRTLILLSLSMIFLSHDVLICPTATKQLKSQLSSDSSCSFMSKLEDGQDLRYPVQCITVNDFLSVKWVIFIIKFSDAQPSNFFFSVEIF